jgi:2-desacetyl-2-hydroxyethyl bacteriochlorophyllide A dehydrogenase
LSTPRKVYFTGPGQVEVRHESLPPLSKGQVLVETTCSAISPGTEMLVYRGQFPHGLADANDRLSSNLGYPLPYGYACVGEVVKISKDMRHRWLGRLVFAFQPHTSHFIVKADELMPVPDGISPEAACFLPNMETAVNLVQDAAPLLGEGALVFGQGIVGLLVAALLAEFPLASLVTCDRYPLRREASLSLGVTAALDPGADDFRDQVRRLLPSGADLSLEVSGSPAALEDAIALTGFGGRIVIGSWYGDKKATLDLGGTFHRSRIQLLSSQVSTISPRLRGRWDKARRFEVAWEALKRIQPQKWITNRFPMEQAEKAYDLLARAPEETIQVLFEYGKNINRSA